MSLFFRGLLIVASLFFCIYILHKIRKAQLQIERAFFWVVLSVVFVVISIFPSIVEYLTEICGMVAPVNFLFLSMIFLLLFRTFVMSIRLAQLEEKVKNLAQMVSIQNNAIRKEIENDKEISVRNECD